MIYLVLRLYFRRTNARHAKNHKEGAKKSNTKTSPSLSSRAAATATATMGFPRAGRSARATRLQAVARGFLSRKRQERAEAATTLQVIVPAVVRGFQARRRYEKYRKSIVALQVDASSSKTHTHKYIRWGFSLSICHIHTTVRY